MGNKLKKVQNAGTKSAFTPRFLEDLMSWMCVGVEVSVGSNIIVKVEVLT